jgi:phosphopantetheinyl transferase
MIRLRLIQVSQDEEAETIDEAFMGNFIKHVESIVQVSPDGTTTTTNGATAHSTIDAQPPPVGEELYSGHHPPPLSLSLRQILRYVKNRDRWLALASCLLKSQVYQFCIVSFALADDDDDGYGKKPPQDGAWSSALVELPRSPYNKPFIPLLKARRQREKEQQFIYEAFSVSHQWPFAGVALLDDDDIDDQLMISSSSSPRLLQVGLDIVVFDPPNDRLYTSVMEFVEVFQSQFTANEWQEIVEAGRRFGQDDGDMLREFYLRWAVKEAYTKALGKGMHVNFAAFEFRFTYRPWLSSSSISSVEAECDDNNNDNDNRKEESLWLEDGLWRWLCSQPQSASIIDAGICLPLTGMLIETTAVGIVDDDGGGSSRSTTTNNDRQWQFFFLPLHADDDDYDDDRPPYDNDDDDDDDAHRSFNKKTRRAAGCACVCVGPLARSRLEDGRRNGIDIRSEWSSVTGLMEWHCR